MQVNKRQIDIAFIAGGILLVLGYVFLFQKPFCGKVKNLRSEKKLLAENKNSIAILKEKLALFEKAETDLTQEIQTLESDFKAGVIWDIMKKIDAITKGSGLNILLMHPNIEVTNDTYQHNSLDIKFKGDFISFYYFLYLLEKDFPTLKTQLIQIEADAKQGPDLLGEVHFEVYSREKDGKEI
ncbi:MAG: hypothetical protein JXA79_10915 [Deltaproteobacteria bacterium]|nr:hypothetical protein [Deltaproteobacteria bacterium]